MKLRAFLPALALAISLALATAESALAQVNKTPDLASTVPGFWSTDRYAPQIWQLTGTFQGRNNVATIGVDPSGSLPNRLPPYNASFYNYQGKQIGIDPTGTTPAGSQYVSMDLWLDPTWAVGSLGSFVSTGMWSRVNFNNTNLENDAYYPILAFSNYSGIGKARYWDSNLGWQDLAATLNYGAWNTFEILYTGNIFSPIVNGQTGLYTETAPAGIDRISTVFLEDYNDPTGQNAAFNANYTNTRSTPVVPEPATMTMLATGLVGITAFGRRRNRRTQKPAAA